uniref:Uncharacterized protein n=1 Tax=Triticum urartu TaxID=4572 RepID=A0A8R7P9Q6_TRIUA
VAVAAAALYARAASSLLRPGLPRLVALLPVLALLAAAPLAFASSAIVRGVAAFFLAWLGAFKVALLAAGRGPLDPALPVLPFLFTALLPVRGQGGALARLLRGQGRRHGRPRGPLPAQRPAAPLRAPGAVRRPHLLLPGPAPPLRRRRRGRARHGDGAAVRPAVPGLLAAGLLGPAVEPHGVGHPPAVGVRPRARPRGGRRGRAGLVCGVRGDARGHGVLPQPAVAARRRDGRLLRPPRRLLRRRGVVRAAVGGEEAAAARRGDGGCGAVRGGHVVLALLP